MGEDMCIAHPVHVWLKSTEVGAKLPFSLTVTFASSTYSSLPRFLSFCVQILPLYLPRTCFISRLHTSKRLP